MTLWVTLVVMLPTVDIFESCNSTACGMQYVVQDASPDECLMSACCAQVAHARKGMSCWMAGLHVTCIAEQVCCPGHANVVAT